MTNPTLDDLLNIISKSDINSTYFNDVITILSSFKDITMQNLIQRSRLPRSIIIKIIKQLQIFLQDPTEYIMIKGNCINLFQKYLERGRSSELTKYDWVEVTNNQELNSFLEKSLKRRAPPKRSLDQFDATLDTLLRRVKFFELNSSFQNSKILFLGDYDLTSLAVAKIGGFQEIHVIDIDQELLNLINKIAEENHFPISTHLEDIRLTFPTELISKFDIVFTDPPFTINGAKLFLVNAINALAPNGVIYCSFGYSVNDLLIGRQFQEILNELGLVARSVLENFNVYSKAQSIGSTSHLFKLQPTRKIKIKPPQISGSIYTGYTEKEDLRKLVGSSIRFKLIDQKTINLLIREILIGTPKSVAFINPTYGILQNQLIEKGISVKIIELDNLNEEYFEEMKKSNAELIRTSDKSKYFFDKLVIETPCINLDEITDWIQIKSCKSVYILLSERFQSLKIDSNKIKISFLTKSILSIFWKWNIISELPPEAFEPRYSQTVYLYRVTPLLKELLLPHFSKYVIREIFEQPTKKIFNALREGIIRYYQKMGKNFTKKQSIQLIRQLNMPNNILNLEILQLSKDELNILFNVLFEKLK